MLYLRNTNLVQSLGKDIKRGVANICCTPTLESVTTASFTQLNVNVLFGTYLVNCKSCVGGYIQVSENSGSTWTTINPGNCSPSNLVPMPSQSAYYRAFTSCSAVDQPFDPLVSDFSNEIFFVPNSRLNYRFTENGAEGQFKLIVTGSTILNTTTSDSGTFYQIPSASAVSASVGIISVPATGSTSMSLWITGSNVSYYTSSCVTQSGSIFIGNYVAIPNLEYYVTASIDHLPGRQAACGTNQLTYTVDSCDTINDIWYVSNAEGTFTSQSTAYGFITGSAYKSNIETGDCRQNALYFSGSAVFPTTAIGNGNGVYLSIVTGSFTLTGVASSGGNDFPWTFSSTYEQTGSVRLAFGGGGATDYTYNNQTNKNSIVGFKLTSFVSPFGRRNVEYWVSGSLAAVNPPNTGTGFPDNLGATMTLSGVGVIRSFGWGPGDTAQQSYFDCLYQSTPSQ